MTRHKWMFRKGWTEGDVLPESDVPVDPALPRLGMLLNTQVMSATLGSQAAEASGNGLRIDRCSIVGVSYRPGRECRVTYALETYDTRNGEQASDLVCATIMAKTRTENLLPRRMRNAKNRAVTFEYLPDYQMIVSTFPNDLRVRTLYRMFDAARFEKVIRRALCDPTIRLQRSDDGSPRLPVASYRPERSCLLKCSVSRGEGEDQHSEEIFARIYRHKRGENIYQAMAMLWDGAARRNGTLGVAEPLGYDARARILFQGCVNGSPLGDMTTSDGFLENVGACAQHLAAIHLSPAHIKRTRTLEDELDWIELSHHGLEGVLPSAGKRLGEIIRRLRSAMANVSHRSQTFIHGDFSLNQVMAEGGRVSVIDFDDACMADRYADLGTFLARLERRVQNDDTRHQAREVFLQEYEGAYQESIEAEDICWHQAVAFVRLAFSSIAHLKPGWQLRTDQFFDLAEAQLSGAPGQ